MSKITFECKQGDHIMTVDTDQPNYDQETVATAVMISFMEHNRQYHNHRSYRPQHDQSYLMTIPTELIPIPTALLYVLENS